MISEDAGRGFGAAARSLGAETWRKKNFTGLEVVVGPPHGFGAVDEDRLHLDADLVRTSFAPRSDLGPEPATRRTGERPALQLLRI
jgi:hypothetical protein